MIRAVIGGSARGAVLGAAGRPFNAPNALLRSRFELVRRRGSQVRFDSTAKQQSRADPLKHQMSFLANDQNVARLLVERVTELDKRLNYQGWHTLRWTSLLLLVAGSLAYFFKEDVSSGVGDAASEVTRRTLENQDVQQQASALARGVVYELLNDQKALDYASQFVNEVIQRESTKNAMLELVKDVLARPGTEIALRNLVHSVLTHPDSAEKASEFLQHVVSIPESRDALVTVLHSVFAKEETQQYTSEFFRDVMQTETFYNASNKLGNDTVNYLLANEELRATVVQWCNSVLNDPALQSTAGEAVWNAVKGAFVPWSKTKNGVPNASQVAVLQAPAPQASTQDQASTSSRKPTATLVITEQPIGAVKIVQGDGLNGPAASEEKTAKALLPSS